MKLSSVEDCMRPFPPHFPGIEAIEAQNSLLSRDQHPLSARTAHGTCRFPAQCCLTGVSVVGGMRSIRARYLVQGIHGFVSGEKAKRLRPRLRPSGALKKKAGLIGWTWDVILTLANTEDCILYLSNSRCLSFHLCTSSYNKDQFRSKNCVLFTAAPPPSTTRESQTLCYRDNAFYQSARISP